MPESTDRPDSVMRARNEPTRGRREEAGCWYCHALFILGYMFDSSYKETSCDRLHFPPKLDVIMLHLFAGCSSCEARAQRGDREEDSHFLCRRSPIYATCSRAAVERSVCSCTLQSPPPPAMHVHTHAALTGEYQAFAPPRDRQQAQVRRGPSSSTHV